MLTDYISADQRFVTCSNQDVGMGYGSLNDQPVIMQVPDIRPAILGYRRLGRPNRFVRGIG